MHCIFRLSLMKKPIWFRAKDYGWGWSPATWQAWLILLIFVVLIVLDFYWIDASSASDAQSFARWMPDTMALVLILVAISWMTGEKPGWRWGKKDEPPSL